MIYTRTESNNMNDYNKNNGESCSSKIKTFIKQHPYIFYGIITGIIALIVVVIVLCVVLTKDKDEKEKEEEKNEEMEEIKIFPLEENSKLEVMDIYNNIGNNDKGTLNQFCEYLTQQAINLKEDQKVYLSYYWIINNIRYDYDAYYSGNIGDQVANPDTLFPRKKAVCSGYSRLFKRLLLCMNYEESKIKNIVGYAKGEGYSPDRDPESNHEWNAVEINGKWCLIDTTWDEGETSEYYLCTPPRCFVRDHLPEYNDEDQFLENPISLEKFHKLVRLTKQSCALNLEIIEDRETQNICGKGKLIIKYKSNDDYFIEIMGFAESRRPEFLLKKKEKEFELDLSVNDVGITQFYIAINGINVGPIKFNCNEEPTEKIYYPIHYSSYFYSDAQLISPIEGELTIGQKYTFEIKTNDFDSLILVIGNYYLLMTKKGNVFKEENVYIYSDSISIQNGENTLLYYDGIGTNVDYPNYSSYLGYLRKYLIRLFEPLTGTLIKGNQYKFELRCDTETIKTLQIYYDGNLKEMDKTNNMYSKTITIDPSTTAQSLYIRYVLMNGSAGFIYEYKLI